MGKLTEAHPRILAQSLTRVKAPRGITREMPALITESTRYHRKKRSGPL